jgi:hypothetical protein
MAISCLAAVCDAFYIVTGRIEACDTHAPIPDAEVRLNVPALQRKGETTSRENGEFRVGVNYPPGNEPSELLIKKAGYAESRVDVRDPKVRQSICLQPLKVVP